MTIGDYTILLVEDNPTDVLLIKRALAKTRVANPIQVVDDGDTAVAYLAGQGVYADRSQYPLPILIMLDLKLPKRSGIEVLTWLRAQESLRRIPVVMLTSSNGSGDVNAAYDKGVNSYLVKPVAFEGLVEMFGAVNFYWLMMNTKPELPAE
jgi:CheY-like chemotaxis protein